MNMKTACFLAVIPLTLFITACDDTESTACRYYIQNDLDNANFDSAINRLEDSSCQDTYPENEYLVDESSAYLGKSGLALPVILRAMIEDDTATESLTFERFVGDITQSASDTALFDLDRSRDALSDYLNNTDCNSIEFPTSAEENVCLITGFIDVLRTTLAIDALTGGNVATWIDNKKGEDNPAMLRSTCALKYSYEHKNEPDFSLPYNECEVAVTVDDSEAVTFTPDNGDPKSYNHLTVSYKGESEYFLESTTEGSTIFTKNYCTTEYAVCNDVELPGCYTCPLSQAEEDLSMSVYLVDSLNNGFEGIESVTQTSGSNDDAKVQESIDDFKKEIKSEGCSAEEEAGNDCFDIEDIIDYLNKK